MAPNRPTPSPPPGVCPHHSGLHERIRDLEGRVDGAREERKEMSKQITDLRLTIAKWVGGMAVALASLQIVLKFIH